MRVSITVPDGGWCQDAINDYRVVSTVLLFIYLFISFHLSEAVETILGLPNYVSGVQIPLKRAADMCGWKYEGICVGDKLKNKSVFIK